MPPPTLANSATDDAPNPNPATMNGSLKVQYSAVTPISPIPTTVIPITAPPENATRSAGPSPCCAFAVVLVLDLTATFIPMNPASPDATAPARYEIAVAGNVRPSPAILSSTSASMNIHRMAKMIRLKAPRTAYSLLRKAIAPSWIALPISRIVSFPSSCRRMYITRAMANTSAVAPAAKLITIEVIRRGLLTGND